MLTQSLAYGPLIIEEQGDTLWVVGGWLVSLYVCLYSISVLFLGYVCLYASYVTSPATASVIGLTQVPSVRGLLVVALLNLAGLPPCIFFVAKLGLIVYLLGSTSGGL